jgi:hypothetical protein
MFDGCFPPLGSTHSVSGNVTGGEIWLWTGGVGASRSPGAMLLGYLIGQRNEKAIRGD